jgi:hypothetical protein
MTDTDSNTAAIIARKTWRTLEPIHGMVYFAPEAATHYGALGLEGPMGYFASRSAPMGAVAAEVVIATYNFNPVLVRSAIPEAWARATTEAILAARLAVADGALTRLLGEGRHSSEMAKAAELAKVAAEAACTRPQGRALFAGHASLSWPDEPHLVLWHAQSLLREFRGDGHIAALVDADLNPVEALVMHAASGEVAEGPLRATRSWSAEEWAAGVESMTARGWLEAGTLTLSPEGAARRQAIEDATDRLSTLPYRVLGEDACSELRTLARPFSKAVVEGGFGGLGSGFNNDR